MLWHRETLRNNVSPQCSLAIWREIHTLLSSEIIPRLDSGIRCVRPCKCHVIVPCKTHIQNVGCTEEVGAVVRTAMNGLIVYFYGSLTQWDCTKRERERESMLVGRVAGVGWWEGPYVLRGHEPWSLEAVMLRRLCHPVKVDDKIQRAGSWVGFRGEEGNQKGTQNILIEIHRST